MQTFLILLVERLLNMFILMVELLIGVKLVKNWIC